MTHVEFGDGAVYEVLNMIDGTPHPRELHRLHVLRECAPVYLAPGELRGDSTGQPRHRSGAFKRITMAANAKALDGDRQRLIHEAKKLADRSK